MLTAEDVVKRIAAECAFVDDRGGIGIRPRTGGGDLSGSTAAHRRQVRRSPKAPTLL